MAGKIFINYRRDDVKADALGIYKALAAKYGTAGVFMDVRDLSGGQVFDKVIADELAQSDVLVAVIGPNWMNLLSARMAAGNKDLMREEIATALERNLIVIQVLIDSAPPPRADTLPDDVRALATHEAEEVRFKYFDRDMENITAVIDARREQRARKAIKNSEQLWLWLKERPIEVSRAIAARAALRAFPWSCDVVERLAQKRAQATETPVTPEQAMHGLSQDEEEYRGAMQAWEANEQAELERADGQLLNIIRGIAIAWFAAAGSDHVTDELEAAALAAARAIDVPSMNYFDVAFAAREAALTAVADISRTRSATLTLEPVGRYAARAAAPHSADAADATATARAADLKWFESGQTGPALAASPLWPEGTEPDEWASRWQSLRLALLAIDPTWEVWITWYGDRVGGAPFDAKIERRRVLFADDIWNQPPAAVNSYISRLVASAR